MPLSAEYVAGLFDGEGCVTFYRTRHWTNPVLVIAMTDRSVLEACAEQWGGRVHATASGTNRQMFHWRLFGGNAARFADDILPFLWVKRDEVAIVRPVLGVYGHGFDKLKARGQLAELRALRIA